MNTPTLEQALANIDATRTISNQARANIPDGCDVCGRPVTYAVSTVTDDRLVSLVYCCDGHVDTFEEAVPVCPGVRAVVTTL